MKRKTIIPVVIILQIILAATSTLSCTAFHLTIKDGHFVGKNYDWTIS